MVHRVIAVVSVMALVLSTAASSTLADTAPDCVPVSDPICQLVRSTEFAAAYREASAEAIDPADAVDDVRANLRRALLGAGQAGPAAIGRQVDAVLDDALDRAQRGMCGPGAQPGAAIAAGLSVAAKARGTQLTPAILGAMTGTLIGAAGARGPACLCAARGFDAIPESCAPR